MQNENRAHQNVEQLKLGSEALCYEKKPKKDNNLYDMEVTEDDKEKICIKIHFVCYGNELDDWRDFDIDSDQLLFVPGICPR